MLLKSRQVDATKGNILKLLIQYSIPLVLLALMQKMFNAVDIVVLGNFADSEAVASVGATTVIVHLMVDSFFGLSNGTKILLARQIGAKDHASVRKTVNTSMISAVVIGSVLAFVGLRFAPDLLEAVKCPPECFDGAVLYIRIYVASAPAMLIYNFGSSVLTASGDTQRPLYYMFFSGIFNIVCNIILCLVLPQKVAAVAIATAGSQVLGAVLVLWRLFTSNTECRLVLKELGFSIVSFGRIMRFGLPIAISTALYPFATLQIQSAINSYGVSAVSGSTAAITLEGVPQSFAGAFATATTTFMSQNIGAKLYDRVEESFRKCLMLSVGCAGSLGVILFLMGDVWLTVIVPDDPAAWEFAKIRMFYTVCLYALAATNNVLSHAIQAYGAPTYSMLNSIFSVLVFRIIWMRYVYPNFEDFNNLMSCFFFSWCSIFVFNIIGYTIFKHRFYKKVERERKTGGEEILGEG